MTSHSIVKKLAIGSCVYAVSHPLVVHAQQSKYGPKLRQALSGADKFEKVVE